MLGIFIESVTYNIGWHFLDNWSRKEYEKTNLIEKVVFYRKI